MLAKHWLDSQNKFQYRAAIALFSYVRSRNENTVKETRRHLRLENCGKHDSEKSKNVHYCNWDDK